MTRVRPSLSPHPAAAEPWEEALPDGDGPVALGAGYLRAVARLEDLPENQSGTDKTWVIRAMRIARNRRAKATRAR